MLLYKSILDSFILYNFNSIHLCILNKIKKSVILTLIFSSSCAFAYVPLDRYCSSLNNVASDLAKSGSSEQDEETVDSATKDNKEKCDPSLSPSFMLASWPDMRALNLTEYEEKTNKVDILVIKVLSFKEIATDVTYVRDYYLTKNEDTEVSSTRYIDKLGLYFATVTVKSKKYTLGHYWQEVDKQVPIVINCVWNEHYRSYALCNIFFVMQELGTTIDVTFTPEKLPEWKEIVKRTEQHIIYRIKNRLNI